MIRISERNFKTRIMKLYLDIVEKVYNDINLLYDKNLNNIKQAEFSIQYISEGLYQLKNLVIKKGFTSIEKEIIFFKEIKPKMLAELFYNTQLLEIELKRNILPNEEHKILMQQKISNYAGVLNDNIDFIRYYRSEETSLDEVYFVRNTSITSKIHFWNTHLHSDVEFSTSHDLLVAYLLVHEKLQIFFQKGEGLGLMSSLTWTDSKASLVELIYALYYSGAIDNGKTDLRELSKMFEQFFNIQLDDIYRVFQDIRYRKMNKLKFIDKMRMSLTNRINEFD